MRAEDKRNSDAARAQLTEAHLLCANIRPRHVARKLHTHTHTTEMGIFFRAQPRITMNDRLITRAYSAASKNPINIHTRAHPDAPCARLYYIVASKYFENPSISGNSATPSRGGRLLCVLYAHVCLT